MCVYGGVYYPKNVSELSGGVDILIGTTGRLLHLERERVVSKIDPKISVGYSSLLAVRVSFTYEFSSFPKYF